MYVGEEHNYSIRCKIYSCSCYYDQYAIWINQNKELFLEEIHSQRFDFLGFMIDFVLTKKLKSCDILIQKNFYRYNFCQSCLKFFISINSKVCSLQILELLNDGCFFKVALTGIVLMKIMTGFMKLLINLIVTKLVKIL